MMARLPMGFVPEACQPQPLSPRALARQQRLRSRIVTALVMGVAMFPVATFADVIYASYLGPQQEAPTAAQMTAGGVQAVYGTESFDTRPLSAPGGGVAFTTNFGLSGSPISATIGGSFGILTADQYGGAGGTGRYLATFSNAPGITITFAHTAAVKGVNYFGLAVSALDAGNVVTVLNQGVVLATFNAATVGKALGACPDIKNKYCGNPTTGQNPGEQYGFLNFFDLNGYFDQVVLTEAGSGGFEVDNFVAGYRAVDVTFGPPLVPVPAPGSLLMLAPLLGVLGLARRFVWRRKTPC